MRIIKGNSAIDERGKLSFVNDFDFSGVKRFYVVENHSKGFVRAWHGHIKEAKYVYVVSGAILLGAVDLDSGDISTHVLSAEKPEIVHIPPNHANGFKTLQNGSKVMFFSTTTLGEFEDDDIRFPANEWDIWEIPNR